MAGAHPNLPCVFPFEYEETIYESCKWHTDGTRWCSTKVDADGIHQKGHWGDCGENCPKGQLISECLFDVYVWLMSIRQGVK